MLVIKYVNNKQNLSETKTYEEFSKWLGTKPQRLGIMSRMYPNLTASFITEGLANVFHISHKKQQFKSLEAPYFEWEIEAPYIKRIPFAAVPEQDGAGGSEITMYFTERYYEHYDIFKIDTTRQQCLVVARPRRVSDDKWEYTVRLIDNDFSSILDLNGCQIGDTTRFQSNAFHEMHSEGYIKYQSNVETHREYLTTHRVDVEYSAQFAATEQMFIDVAQGKDKDNLTHKIFRMDKKEKQLLDNFLYVRNNGLLFNRGNVDKNGKATIQNENGIPIIIGNGFMPQIERFCGKYVFNKWGTVVLKTALSEMVAKAETPTGNIFGFICNEKMWHYVQNLQEFLSWLKPLDSSYLYSKDKGGYVKVGATFSAYEYAGNTIHFTVDRALSYEYGDKAFGVFVDLTADSNGTPAVSMFTLKNGDFISNKFLGVGGEDGLTSGNVASVVAASRLIMWGYSGMGVFNPYRSYMIMEA